MSLLHVQQIRGYLEKEIAKYIDTSDVTTAATDQRDATVLTRSLAAFAVLQLSDASPQAAASAVTDGTGDNGIDAVYFDKTEKVLIVIQSKWHSDGRGSIERGDCQKMIVGIRDLVNTQYGRFNDKLRLKAKDIESAVLDAQSRMMLVLVHTGQDQLAPEVQRDIDDLLREMNDPSDTMIAKVIDQRTAHGLIAAGAKGIPIDLEVALSEWGQMKEPFAAVYGYVHASDVAAWWHRYYPRLFAPNLRMFLGSTEVNSGILDTLRNEPERFWYYNNGITALCRGVTKKLIGGASREQGLFDCKGVAIVNGAQTVGAIAAAVATHQNEVSRARVLVRFISLEGAPESLATYITQFTNTQNRVERRDFVSLDPEQERLKTELQLDGIDYVYKSGDQAATGRPGCDLVEASVALACSQSDLGLAVQAKREIGKLWEDIAKAPYKALFNGGLNGRRLWRAVEMLRLVETVLKEQQRRLSGRNRLYAVHGNRFIAWLAMQSWKTPDDGPPKDARDHVAKCLETLIRKGNELYPEVYLASLFKNASKCKRLAEGVLADGIAQ